MAASSETTEAESGSDVLSSVGLLLNLAGVIGFALWLSMIGGAYRGGSATVAGVATLVCFAASFGCFAADRPAGSAPISSGRYPTAP